MNQEKTMSINTSAIQTETLDLEVNTAAHAFAQSLAESAEFQAYERASERLSQDETAQKAIRAFQNKQMSLQMMLRLNAVSPEDRAELESLQKAFMDQPSVMAYLKAQEELSALCQAAANLLSERIGLSYTAACGPGCC
jgi:cell fate (sporulation/competence/biofilm development) regulator YlbF (YheA/YmcA/DUF963 family)